MWRTRSITRPKVLSIFWKFLQLETWVLSKKKRLELGQEVLSWNVRTWQFGLELCSYLNFQNTVSSSYLVVFQNYRTIGSNSLKKSELNEPLVWVISKTKEPAVFMKEPMVSPIVGYLIFQFWEPWLFITTRCLRFLRTMVMNKCPFNGGERFARVSVSFFKMPLLFAKESFHWTK